MGEKSLQAKIGADLSGFRNGIAQAIANVEKFQSRLKGFNGVKFDLKQPFQGLGAAIDQSTTFVKALETQLSNLERQKESLNATDKKAIASIEEQIAAYRQLIDITKKQDGGGKGFKIEESNVATVKQINAEVARLKTLKQNVLVSDKQTHLELNKQIADLERIKRSVDQVGTSQRKNNQLFRSGASELQDAAGALAGFLAADQVRQYGTELIKTAGNFEASMNRVGAASQTNADQLARATDLARDLGATTQFSASQAADAIEVLVKNGVPLPEVFNGAAQASLILAAALDTDLAGAADLATDVMLNFNKSAKDMGGIIDGIVGATNNSKFGFDDYRLAIAQAGGVAGNLGVELEDLNTALAVTSSAFSSGQDAGTSFKTFLINLAPSTNSAKQAMEDLGLNFFDAAGNMLPMVEVVAQLEKAFGGLSEEQASLKAKDIFGTDAIRTALTLANAGADAYERLQESIGNVSATAQAEARMKGFNGVMKEFNSALEAAELAIADSGLLEFATEFLRGGVELLRGLKDLNPALLRFGTALAGVSAVAIPLVAGMGLLATAVGAVSAPILATVAGVVALTSAIAAFSGGATNDAKKAFEEQKRSVADLEKEIPALIERYKELEGNIDPKAQEELKNVIERIGQVVPTAVTEFDKYGKAIGISAIEAEKFLKHQKELNKALEKEALREAEEQLEDYKDKVRELNFALEDGGKKARSYGLNVTISDQQRVEFKKTKAELEGLIEETEKYIQELKGEKPKIDIKAEVSGKEKTFNTIKEIKARLAEIKTEREKAFDPVKIKAFDDEMAVLEARLKEMQKTKPLDGLEGATSIVGKLQQNMEALQKSFDTATSREEIANLNREMALLEAEMQSLSEIRPFVGLTEGEREAAAATKRTAEALRDAGKITEDAFRDMQGFVIPLKLQLEEGFDSKIGAELNKAIGGALDKKQLSQLNDDLNEALSPRLDNFEGFTTLADQLEIARNEAEVFSEAFGEPFSAAEAQIRVLEQAMLDLIASGKGINDIEVKALAERIEALQPPIWGVTSAASAFGQAMSSQFTEAGIKADGLAKTLGNVARETIKIFLAEAVAASIAKSFASSPNPLLGLALAAASGAAITGLFAAIPKFKDGAYLDGSNAGLAIFGEAGPEFAVPEPKMEELLRKAVGQGGGIGGNVTFEIRGDRLIGVLSATQKRNAILH